MLEDGLSLEWKRAALELEARLRSITGQAAHRLDPTTVAVDYPNRAWIVAAWRVSVMFNDGTARQLDVLVSRHFPFSPVRTALVDHPEPMTWPHVEADGVLCLLPNMSEADPDDPSGVAHHLFAQSCRLIDELIEGSIIDRDFRDEFLTYWGYRAHHDGANLYSTLDPAGPSRSVRLWKGEGIEVVGEDDEALKRWVKRRFGTDNVKTVPAAFLWLDVPLLPAQYPETAADVRAIADAIGPEAALSLTDGLDTQTSEKVVVMGAVGRGGPGLVTVRLQNPKRQKTVAHGPADPLAKGFRPRATPNDILVDRFFNDTRVIRGFIQRADASWIHGRGQDSRSERLLGKKVIVVGSGSVGAPVACYLAQAGVGQITLFDNDTLSWPNVGRHPLGASAVGQPKAVALAERLQTDYPHLEVAGYCLDLFSAMEVHRELFSDADLIVSATGSWAAESHLNKWHIALGRNRPVLYGWTEAHAVAGHAVCIVGAGGCLKCHIGRTGRSDFEVARWNTPLTTLEEPACGAHYQPYGPVELGYVTTMISEAAIDCLLSPPNSSMHRLFATSAARLQDAGGTWTSAWLETQAHSQFGEAKHITLAWPPSDCPACGSYVSH